MEISKYNINYGKIDKGHVAILKAQLKTGINIPIKYYVKDGRRWVIDGGHTLIAYHELNKEPPIQIEIPFTTPEDLIALSRHCNVNRIVQKPITYTESIAEEVKLRLKIEDSDLMSVFAKFTMATQRGDVSAVVDVPHNVQVLTDVFKNERVTVSTFRSEYLPLLKLPIELKTAIDTGKIAKSVGSELVRIKEPDKQQELGKIAREEQLSVSEVKAIKQSMEETDCSVNHATAEILEERAFTRRHHSPEQILKTIQSNVRKNKRQPQDGTITEFTIKCLKCNEEITVQHIDPSGKHKLKVEQLTEPLGARITEEIDKHITDQTEETGKNRSAIATDLMRIGLKEVT